MKSQSLTIVLHSLGLKIIVDLLLLTESKCLRANDIYSHQRAARQTWLTLGNSEGKRKQGAGLNIWLAGPCAGRPAGYSVFFLYNWHCSASLSRGGLTPAHCAGFIWAASCAARRNLTWPPLLTVSPRLCLSSAVGSLRSERCLLSVCLTFVTCLCIYVHRGREGTGLRWLWKDCVW